MATTDLAAAPQQLAGYTDLSTWAYALNEVTEHVSKLHWPMSVEVYAEMRRDPQLAAILTAYTQPIRRATWSVDPAGCRDEVVRLVADDMGLPVNGDDTPGAARTRGLSWPDHLRAALACLTFGHSCFEALAKVTNGQARLVGLFERMPTTISWIYVDEQGRLDGISQTGGKGPGVKPEITADRLVWYTNEREGGNWAGTSLLRPSYAAFVLKREMMRVAATSHKRFGMGVPTIEWAAGVVPTQAQMTAVEQAASAARVGNTSGLALPPGAHLVLTGLSGGTPDTLAFLRWLDQQMAGSVLGQWMTLGETTFGSRALGESFLDAFLLALQSTADLLADTATRQIAARIVAWNYGEDEPVPAVRVADVGTRHEVTADALQMLLGSGAIQPDPALDAYMRREYRLPERTVPWVAPAKPAAGGKPPTPGGMDSAEAGSVAASTGGQGGNAPRRGRGRRESADGQLELPIAAADSTDGAGQQQGGADLAEHAAGHQADWEQAKQQVLDAWPQTAQPMVDDLSQQAVDNSDSGDLAKLATIAVSAAVIAGIVAALTPSFTHLAAEAVEHVIGDGRAHGRRPGRPADSGAQAAAQSAALTANLVATGYAQAATRKAMQVAGGTPDEVRAAVSSALTDMGTSPTGLVADQVGAGLSAAQNGGRRAVFTTLTPGRQIAGYAAHETLDRNTCPSCAATDRKTYATLDEALKDYPVSGNRSCDGGGRCRGFLRPIWR